MKSILAIALVAFLITSLMTTPFISGPHNPSIPPSTFRAVHALDHFAIGVDNFNKESVTADLKARGVTPKEEGDAAFHVVDPDGYPVQISANT